jgi:hypothetical protein
MRTLQLHFAPTPSFCDGFPFLPCRSPGCPLKLAIAGAETRQREQQVRMSMTVMAESLVMAESSEVEYFLI